MSFCFSSKSSSKPVAGMYYIILFKLISISSSLYIFPYILFQGSVHAPNSQKAGSGGRGGTGALKSSGGDGGNGGSNARAE